ncbi:MAG: NAD(P)/FAD-dependent oxidoreductase, partial [Sulfurimonas sp.]
FAILDISQAASEALLNYQSVDIGINLLPSFTAQKLSAYLLKTSQMNPTLTLFTILSGILPMKIINAVLESLQLEPTTQALDTKQAKKIANQILNWKFEVSSTHGFRHAEVSGGGVDTTEIDPKTFQSKKDPKYYFTGEVLDVVGRRGGINFAFAWASGYFAAQNIIKN